MVIDTPYYEDMSRYSNSDIGYFLKNGPKGLKDYKEGKVAKLDYNFLEKGTMIHEYLLQPEEFWKDYIILDFATPKVKQQKDLLDEYHRLMQVNPLESQDKLKLSAYKKAYSNKKSNEKCIEEAEGLIMIYQDYLEYLSKVDENKKIISFADYKCLRRLKKIFRIIKKQTNCCLIYHLLLKLIMSSILIGKQKNFIISNVNLYQTEYALIMLTRR